MIVGKTSTNACENAHLEYPLVIVNHADTFGILFTTNYNLGCTNANLAYYTVQAATYNTQRQGVNPWEFIEGNGITGKYKVDHGEYTSIW